MKKLIVALILVAGCKSGGSADDCEAARGEYMAMQRTIITAAIATVDPAERAEIERQAAAELATAEQRFTPACKEIGGAVLLECTKKVRAVQIDPSRKKELERDTRCAAAVDRLNKLIYPETD